MTHEIHNIDAGYNVDAGYKNIMTNIIKIVPLYCIHNKEYLYFRIQELIEEHNGGFGDPGLVYKFDIHNFEMSGYIYSPKYYHTEKLSIPFVKEKENKICRFIDLKFRYDEQNEQNYKIEKAMMRYYSSNIVPFIHNHSFNCVAGEGEGEGEDEDEDEGACADASAIAVEIC